MRIVVDHLTRMDRSYICVAGVDVLTGAHVRPVVDHRMSEHLLRRFGGPFDIGALVDIGDVRSVGKPPMVEDHSFSVSGAQRLKDISPTVFWRMLEKVARDDLHVIFGADLERRGRTYTLNSGQGQASLGCLRATGARIECDPEFGKLRLALPDPRGPLSLSLTDLRLYERDHETIRGDLVGAINARLAAGTPLVVCVGLGRPYKKLGDTAWRHWLQANNLHLADQPLWQEGTIAE